MVRSSVIEVLESDYVLMARLKGVPFSRIVLRHVLPNSLLPAIGDAPAQVFLEAGCDDDRHLPVVRDADITWVDRKDGALLEAVRSAACDGGCHFGWVACDSRTTRSVVKVLREDFGIPRKSIKSQAYWVA